MSGKNKEQAQAHRLLTSQQDQILREFYGENHFPETPKIAKKYLDIQASSKEDLPPEVQFALETYACELKKPISPKKVDRQSGKRLSRKRRG